MTPFQIAIEQCRLAAEGQDAAFAREAQNPILARTEIGQIFTPHELGLEVKDDRRRALARALLDSGHLKKVPREGSRKVQRYQRVK